MASVLSKGSPGILVIKVKLANASYFRKPKNYRFGCDKNSAAILRMQILPATSSWNEILFPEIFYFSFSFFFCYLLGAPLNSANNVL